MHEFGKCLLTIIVGLRRKDIPIEKVTYVNDEAKQNFCSPVVLMRWYIHFTGIQHVWFYHIFFHNLSVILSYK